MASATALLGLRAAPPSVHRRRAASRPAHARLGAAAARPLPAAIARIRSSLGGSPVPCPTWGPRPHAPAARLALSITCAKGDAKSSGSSSRSSSIVAGDIGGTNARLQQWTIKKMDGAEETGKHEMVFQKIYPTSSFFDFDLVLKQFLEDSEAGSVDAACFAVAGPVSEGKCKMTNLGWNIDGEELGKEFGIREVSVINDFEAIGYGVPAIPKDQIFSLNDVPRDPRAPVAIVGPGTGLGEATLMWDEGLDGYSVHPSEGGHADFAPRGWKQRALAAYVEEREGFCELEHVLCGNGLVTIHNFLRTQRELGPSVAGEEMTAPAITRAAIEDTDPLCREAVDMFLSILGAECSNQALRTLAKGGVYIAGGITPKLLDLVKEGGVLSAFINARSPKFSPILQDIPLDLVLMETVGLLGAKEFAVIRWRQNLNKK